MLLYQVLVFTINGKILKNHTKIISTPTWNEEFELPSRLYSVSCIQDYFEYIIKKHETVTDSSSIRMYVIFIILNF